MDYSTLAGWPAIPGHDKVDLTPIAAEGPSAINKGHILLAWLAGNDTELKAIKQLDAELGRSSGRAAAIIAGSLVEARVDALLAHSVTDRAVLRKHAHASGALGSFAIKIDVLYLTGKITKAARGEPAQHLSPHLTAVVSG